MFWTGLSNISIKESTEHSFVFFNFVLLFPSQHLHVVWLGDVVDHHVELGKLASYERYVLDGGRVALKKVLQLKTRLRSKPEGQKSDHGSLESQVQHERRDELGSRPPRSR